MEDYDDSKKTKFNAGVAKLMRIDKIKTQLVVCNRFDDEKGKLSLLESFRTEIEERLNPDEKKLCDSYENKGASLLNASPSVVKWDRDILDDILKKYERYLNELEYKYGYSMPDVDEDEGL